MIEVMGVLMGIDLQAFGRPEGSGADNTPPAFQSKPTPPPQPSASSSTPAPSSSREEDKDEEMPDLEPAEQDPDVIEEKKAKAAAEEQKKIGSDAYRKRDFDAAAAAFAKAWELWPKDITFLTNLSGQCLVYYLLQNANTWIFVKPFNLSRAIMMSASPRALRPSTRVDLCVRTTN